MGKQQASGGRKAATMQRLQGYLSGVFGQQKDAQRIVEVAITSSMVSAKGYSVFLVELKDF